jgi:pimeloyl-ACP methyl ester carboxylesterase
VIHFAPAEAQCYLDLVALFKETLGGAHFHFVIMIIDHRAKLDFLELDDLLLLARLGRFFLLLEFELPVVENLRDWRLCIRRDFDEIKTRFVSHGDGLSCGNDTDIDPVGADQPDFARFNTVVDAVCFFLCLWLGTAVDRGAARRYAQVTDISKLFFARSATNCESGLSPLASFHTEMKGQTAMAQVAYEDGLKGERLAYLKDGRADELGATGFFWLGGFMSDMTGSKASTLSELAHTTRRSCLRFDYSGHGQSAGAFTDGTISKWLEQSTHMFLHHGRGRRIVVGSSMGGWLALLLAGKLAREDRQAFRRISGLVLIAPAVDMTRDLMWDAFTPEQQRSLLEDDRIDLPSRFGAPYPIMRALIEDGERHVMLQQKLSLPFPVRILQGTDDAEVPVSHAGKVLHMLDCDDITLTLIKDGDHRLSKLGQLRIIQETVLRLAERADGTDH